MTEIREAVREGSPPEILPPTPEAESAQRVRSVAQPASIAVQAVTDSAQAARRFLVSVPASLDRRGSLFDAQPPTFRQARTRHHECADHFQAGLLRWPRYVWGYFHLLIVKPLLNLAEWVTESPARFFVAVIIVAVIWFWSLT